MSLQICGFKDILSSCQQQLLHSHYSRYGNTNHILAFPSSYSGVFIYLYHISIVASNSTKTRGKVFRRDASSPFLQRRSSYQGSPDLNSGHTHSTSVRDISVGVVVCVVGVVVMIVLLAMCGGSSSDDKYEPSKAAKRNERPL